MDTQGKLVNHLGSESDEDREARLQAEFHACLLAEFHAQKTPTTASQWHTQSADGHYHHPFYGRALQNELDSGKEHPRTVSRQQVKNSRHNVPTPNFADHRTQDVCFI